MKQIVRDRSLSGIIAHPAVGQGEQGHTDHGRQDKGADQGRAHVIGWIGFSGFRPNRYAGASVGKHSLFNVPGAIAPLRCLGGST